jgi:3-deoxy-manno-octulosonate cytidylyltransferase (CMP-KDO synthetase)
MKIIAIIPARMGSSRFPGKPMEKILGIPMIEHVYRRVKENKNLSQVAIATCDEVIMRHIESIGGMAVMTSSEHERASDRCAEALKIIEDNTGQMFEIVVMVQGDEPMIYPEMIDQALAPLFSESDIQITNLIGKISGAEEFEDRNCIKVVCDQYRNALYFSREPIPTTSKGQFMPAGKQICVIPFRKNFLYQYNLMKPTPLEIVESIDMLRILENGMQVKMVDTDFSSYSVDTKDDLKRVENLLERDFLYQKIFNS